MYSSTWRLNNFWTNFRWQWKFTFLLKSVLDDDFNVFNYAFNGYRAHQFLSKIENEYIDEIKIKKLFILYQFIPDHIGVLQEKDLGAINRDII